MENDKEHITVFAKTNFRNKDVPFGIKPDDRRRHMYLIGKTGMGKTSMMENMAMQDIRAGHGIAFLDPHGDSIQRILDCIPNNRVNDVIYFNPADLEFPVAFNILESVDPKYKHLVASGLMGVFTKIWANLWSARMEYILNNTILALLDSPGNTLLGITRMYVDKKYRKKIVDNIKDPMVRAFWVDEFANYNEKYRTEAIAPIQNKVGQFLSSGIIRNIVGQPKSTIDLREVMDQRKILIMDLSKGRVGEDNSALLGAMIVTKLQLAAMSRTDIPEHERKDFYLYVDEFQNFATDSFATILSEARKYRLNLIVGHQYIAQLEQDKNTKVRDAIFGNVGTIVVFRIGAADAEYMETEFEPIFTPNDLVNLPKYNIILKLMINGVASDPFSAVTIPYNPEWITSNAEKVIKVSRERYANPVTEVEDKISRWMGAEFHQETAVLIGAGAKAETGASEKEAEQEEMPAVSEAEQAELVIEQSEEAGTKKKEKHDIQPSRQLQGIKPQITQKKAFQPLRQHNNNQPNEQRPQHNQGKHHHQHQKRDKHKPFGQPQKKENPIWNTVASIQGQKAREEQKKLGNIVGQLLDNAKPRHEGSENDSLEDQDFGPEPPIVTQIEPRTAVNPIPQTPSGLSDKVMLNPGEKHIF